VQVAVTAAKQPLRLPVQWVNRPHLDFRGFAGTLAAGTLRPGDPVQVASSGQTSRVARIVTFDGDLPAAIAGQAVTVTLEDEIDISRGDLLVAPQAPPTTSARWEATLVWLYEQPLTLGRSYLLKSGAATVQVQVEQVRELVDVNTLEALPGVPLTLNAIGRVALRLDRPLPLDPYRESRGSGSFILIDRFSNATVAAGLVEAPLAAVADDKRPTVVDRNARATLKGQEPQLLWFSGRDPAAATAVARAVESRLHRRGLHTTLLAAPQLEPDLAGRLPALAHLLLDAGLIVLVVGSEAQAAEAAQLSGDALHLVTLDTELAPATILEQTLQRLEPLLVTNDFVTPGIIC
jgi:bifunctional enzyme CysN/CysC